MPNSPVLEQWEISLRQKYEVPNVEGIEPYYFSLDGGGRDIIISAIEEFSVNLMLEIGCFLCGSTIQWLESQKKLKVIGIDPWAVDFATILERYNGNPVFEPCFFKIEDRERFINSVRINGSYASSIANVSQYKERFIPVQAYSPQVLYELKKLGIKPQLIYFDSTKLMDDLSVCSELFPDAILSGDDWTWGEEQGFPVQKAVNEFCELNNLSVISKRATWIITPKI